MPASRLAWVLALAALLAAPPRPAEGRTPARPSPARKAAPARPPSLERARAQLAAVKRDPAKRRYRHHWERAIRSLEQAARGRDRAPALLEAARARYALYRFSAIEADRAQALRLAGLAGAAGSREAAGLTAAIRREMGDDDRPAPRRRAVAKAGPRSPAAPPRGAERPRPAAADEEATDPELDRVVAEMLQPTEVTSEPVASAVAGSGPEAGTGPARVSEVRTWSSPDYTRVAVTLSRPVDYRETEIAAAGEQPRRLAVDLSPAQLEGKAVARPVGDAKVERVRAAQHDADTVRVVLDLAGNQDYETFRLEDPPRVVVDVGTREAEPPGRAPVAAGAPDDEGGTGPLRPIRRIVVDAGHGGHDPGAIGPGGVREKDVTLAMARRLRRKLERAGFQVVLTRHDDRFLGLDERTALANTARGDLFVSLHANAHPRRDRGGIETYFLNVTDDRYAARLAARENGVVDVDGEATPQVARILSDLDATRSAAPSRRLAGLVQRELVSRVRANVGEVRDLGVKHALFYVLLGARMPAVLVETAFVSNRREERRLASPRYQDEVAEGVARAVANFAGRDTSRVASRSLRPGEPVLYP